MRLKELINENTADVWVLAHALFAFMVISIPPALGITLLFYFRDKPASTSEEVEALILAFVAIFLLTLCVVTSLGCLCWLLLLIIKKFTLRGLMLSGWILAVLVFTIIHGIAGVLEDPLLYLMMLYGIIGGVFFWKIWNLGLRVNGFDTAIDRPK